MWVWFIVTGCGFTVALLGSISAKFIEITMPPVPSLQFAVALLLLLVARSALRPTRESSTRYDEDKIYVHIVPHTHDDVGWLKTVDEYYTGGLELLGIKYQREQKGWGSSRGWGSLTFFCRIN